ncbi:MAG: hypothetical protein GXC78_06070 [Chitinophagaceae bacterium]|nr:hypothetical protein [Chitinophagaceae bacterium]
MKTVLLGKFHKPDHFLTLTASSPVKALEDIIETYTLDDLRQELCLWQEFALCNDDSAYTEAPARENLLAFIHAFQRTIEALYITRLKKMKYKALALSALNTPQLLTPQEQSQPMLVIRQFTEKFSLSYTQAELLDLLEAVICYQGKKKMQLGSVVFIYQRLCLLANVAYLLF